MMFLLGMAKRDSFCHSARYIVDWSLPSDFCGEMAYSVLEYARKSTSTLFINDPFIGILMWVVAGVGITAGILSRKHF